MVTGGKGVPGGIPALNEGQQSDGEMSSVLQGGHRASATGGLLDLYPSTLFQSRGPALRR